VCFDLFFNVFIKGAKAKEERGEGERRRKRLNFNPKANILFVGAPEMS